MLDGLKDSIGNQGVYNSTFIGEEHEISTSCNGEPQIMQDNNSSAPATDEKTKKRENRQVLKSIICNALSLNIAYSVMLTLINSITSLLPENSLGILSLTLGSATQLITTAVILSFSNFLFGMKNILIVSTFLLAFYTAAFFYPVLPLFIPASLGMGIAFAMTVANGFAYGNALGYWYHDLNGGNLEPILSFFSGIINASLGGGFVWGNLIYYNVLKPDYVVNTTNLTDFSICGAAYCNEDLGELGAAKSPPEGRVHTLIYIFLGMLGAAFLLQLLMVEKRGHKESFNNKVWMKCVNILKTQFSLLINPKGYLLILVVLYIGIEEQFVFATFTSAYVNCTQGIEYIGYVMLNFGIAQIIVSMSEGLMVKLIGKPAVVMLSYAVFLGIFITLLIVPPTQFTLITYCIIAFLFAAADSLLVTATFSFYGILFPDDLEGGFSLATMWYSIGSLIGNSTIPYSCVDIKIYTLIALGTTAVSCFLILEYLVRKKYFKTSI